MGKVSSLAEHGLPLWLQLQLSVRTGQIESVATINKSQVPRDICKFGR